MKNKQNLIIVICFIFITFFILLLGLKKENNYVPQTNNLKIEDTLTLKSLYSGKELFLNDLFLKDSFTLINIWASWCLPCKDEHPYLINLNKNYNYEYCQQIQKFCLNGPCSCNPDYKFISNPTQSPPSTAISVNIYDSAFLQ